MAEGLRTAAHDRFLSFRKTGGSAQRGSSHILHVNQSPEVFGTANRPRWKWGRAVADVSTTSVRMMYLAQGPLASQPVCK